MKEIKCKKCGKKLNIEEYINRGDITRVTEDSIEIYCSQCGNIELAKLNRTQEEEVRREIYDIR